MSLRRINADVPVEHQLRSQSSTLPSALPQSFVILAGRLEAVDCAQSEPAQATLRRYPVRADRPSGRKLLDIHGPRGDGRPAPPPAESRSSLA